MQTILGSGGAIGTELAKALKKYTNDIRLVSRHPKKVHPDDQIFSADLLILDQVRNAVKGSSVVYLTAGLPYNKKTWKESWPEVIRNVISACEEYNSKLVFFDNIYMYDPDFIHNMNEETPINPSSEKGKVRASIVTQIMDRVRQGKLKALIARSADFYGPSIQNTSMLTETVLKPLSQGKKANWMSGVNFKHSFTYTPDAAMATALLGNTEDAYDQVWHLPTASDPLTGKQWIETIANEMGVAAKYQAVPKFMVRVIGLFVPIMREMVEMMYQYDRDYVFDSSKFEKRFGIKPTPYQQGIKEIVQKDYSSPK